VKRQTLWLAGLVFIAPLAAQSQSNGFALAIAILIGMAAALIFVGVTWLRSWQSDFSQSPWQPAGLDALMLVLAIAGLAVAGYLTFVEAQAVAAVCGPVGDCNAVQTSSYSRLFGVAPVGLIGMVGYAAILVVWLWGRFGSGRLADYAPLALHGMTIFAVVFSLYLTFLEPFVIKAVCMWCLTSAVVITLIMLLSMPMAIASFIAEEGEE
jgi:uncharacterized membrane protein